MDTREGIQVKIPTEEELFIENFEQLNKRVDKLEGIIAKNSWLELIGDCYLCTLSKECPDSKKFMSGDVARSAAVFCPDFKNPHIKSQYKTLRKAKPEVV